MTVSASSGGVASGGQPSLSVFVTEEAAAHRAEVVRLWRKAGFDGSEDESLARYNWFYLRETQPPRLHLLQSTGSQELIGFVGIGPREWWIEGRRFDAGVLVDFIVSPEHRTLLPAMSLQKHAHAEWLECKDLLYALPNKKAAPIFQRLGAALKLEMAEYVRLVRPKTFLSRILPKLVAEWASGLVAACSRLMLVVQLRNCRLQVSHEHVFDAEFTALWQRLDKTRLSVGTRDALYLSWRFSRKPGRRYRILVVRENISNTLRGYFVYEIRDEAAYVQDFLLEGDVQQQTDAFRLLAQTALVKGVESVRIAVSDVPGTVEALREALFVRRSGRPVFCSVRPGGKTGWQRAVWFFTPADEDV